MTYRNSLTILEAITILILNLLMQQMQRRLSPQRSVLLAPIGDMESEERKNAKLPTKKLWQQCEQMLKQQKLNLSSNFFDEFLLEEIFDGKREFSQVEYLWLYLKKQAKIVKLISCHSMPKLKILNLGENNIVSIENLQHSNFPELQQLWLWNNKIVQVRSLRKIYMPKLQYLDLSYNLIKECHSLSELNAQCLNRVNISNNRLVDVTCLASMMIRGRSLNLQIYNNEIISAFGMTVNLKNRRKMSEVSMKMKGNKRCMKYA